MKILVLGGTGWVSSHVARIALEAGHAVTCLTRSAGVPNGARSVRADRDDANAYDAVAGEHWDAVIDVAREPGHVRRATAALADTAKRYIFVSTISVYADHAAPGADEAAERVPALDADAMESLAEYGSAKVAAENAVLDAFGPERSVIARPGLIGGPGDSTGRTTYWPWRFAHPVDATHIVVPDALDLTCAVIDARDLAAWLVHCASADVSGTFNVLGEQLTLAEHLSVAREVGVAEGGAGVDEPRILPMPESFLEEQGVNPWAGEKSLPLWIPGTDMSAMSRRSVAAAHAAGLRLRPLADTLRDGMWWRGNNGGGAGLGDVDERAVIDAWHARTGR